MAVSLAPDPIKEHLGTKGPFHSAAHFIAFALTAVIFCWRSADLISRVSRAIGACCAAFLLENLEALFYGNPMEWRDVWMGCLGVAFGLAVTVMAQGVRRPADS
jgi:hypothetical protein